MIINFKDMRLIHKIANKLKIEFSRKTCFFSSDLILSVLVQSMCRMIFWKFYFALLVLFQKTLRKDTVITNSMKGTWICNAYSIIGKANVFFLSKQKLPPKQLLLWSTIQYRHTVLPLWSFWYCIEEKKSKVVIFWYRQQQESDPDFGNFSKV